ncbi:MAG: hypothetical protein JSR77_11460 [Planctomycetes bacterium]|nr:hypothetical protein [Planctomycetota bacterium]
MTAFARIILILSLLLQSIPGLSAQRCAEMVQADAQIAPADDDAPCPCCQGDDQAITPACPEGAKTITCCCCMPRHEEPRTPPADPKTEQTHQFVALLPVLVSLLRPEPPVLAQRWTSPAGPPMRSADSMHSLLCVWVV